MPSVSEVLKRKEEMKGDFPLLCSLSTDDLLLVLSTIVQAEYVEELLIRVNSGTRVYNFKKRPPTQRKKPQSAKVRGTTKIIRPVGKPPEKEEVQIVDSVEEAYRVAGRVMR